MIGKQKSRIPRKKNIKNKEIIKLDNEIIIGISPKKENRSRQTKKTKTSKNKKTVGASIARAKNNRKTKRKKIKLKLFKWTSIIILIMTAIILFMLSSVFNIKDIKVNNNAKISSMEIINSSRIQKDENMFKLNTWRAQENIKKEPYIASAQIKRSLNGTININIEEREATYMLEFENSYVYINNQGYMLEITDHRLTVPIITGFVTGTDKITAGNRLETPDLAKLGTVIKIMDAARGNSIASLITGIDISDNQNYILTLSGEGKTVYFGDKSKIKQKVLWVQTCVAHEKEIQGEIFVNNIDKVFFREKVNF